MSGMIITGALDPNLSTAPRVNVYLRVACFQEESTDRPGVARGRAVIWARKDPLVLPTAFVRERAIIAVNADVLVVIKRVLIQYDVVETVVVHGTLTAGFYSRMWHPEIDSSPALNEETRAIVSLTDAGFERLDKVKPHGGRDSKARR